MSDSSQLFNASAGTGTAQVAKGQTVQTFVGSLVSSIALFGAQVAVFYLLRNKFTRIYRPKTYLVPEKARTAPPPGGFWKWVVPIFRTSSAELISKCGLDAYFFLRYLQMLLKIFVPSAILILPILLPINHANPHPSSVVKGLDRLGWQNFDPTRTNRLWAHLLLACTLLFWVLYVVTMELRGYIRVRQAYLTSPQHRLRASATTVLVTSIPRKWLTYEALDGLYDVFPGGIRNIWINRNFDELSDKVKQRNMLALKLEKAETKLIRKAKEKQVEIKQKEDKKAGKKQSKEEKAQLEAESHDAAVKMAEESGISSGDPHQARTLDETLGNVSDTSSEEVPRHGDASKPLPIPIIGQGLETIGHGLGAVGQGFTNFGKTIVGGVRNVPRAVNEHLDAANEGFIVDGARDSTANPSLHSSSRTREAAPYTVATRRSEDPWRHDSRPMAPLHDDSSWHEGAEIPHSSADSTSLDRDQAPPRQSNPSGSQSFDIAVTRPSTSSPTSPTSVGRRNRGEGSLAATDTWAQNLQVGTRSRWKFWKADHGVQLPTPEPKHAEADEYPLTNLSDRSPTAKAKQNAVTADDKVSKSKLFGIFSRGSQGEEEVKELYPQAYDEEFQNDQGLEAKPEWKKYLSESDRSTTRLPLFGLGWMPYLPSWTFLGKKVDVIYYCRQEVARLNLEIEKDQQEPDKYPLMNSAFIQFNHQVAAHMACQSVSHHVPAHMAPRIVEIAPNDVIWDNLSIKWWERLIRIGMVSVFVAALILAWAVPVSFTSAVSNLTWLADSSTAFAWINRIPHWLIAAIQGILPFVLLAGLLALLPVILRLASRLQGNHTGMSVELSVQGYYFAFLFVQVFLIVTISTSIWKLIPQLGKNVTEVPQILARNIPTAGNYFFSYMLLQAMSVSAGSLAQVGSLALWFLWRPIADNTARQKFNRQLRLPYVKWGTFFPIYTNLACIGLIYSVVSPLIIVFNIITFSLFWISYRYQTLYVNQSRIDTGGLLFPKAINQLFTGVYVMEICLIGLFLLVRDDHNSATCLPQAAVMVILFLFTVFYHALMNWFFSPLYRYIPITLEDDAVRRDEEFARAHGKKWQVVSDGEDDEDIENALQRREWEEQNQERLAEEAEAEDIREKRRSGGPTTMGRVSTLVEKPFASSRTSSSNWAERSRNSRAHEVDEKRLSSQHISPHRHSRHHHHHHLKAASHEKDLESGGIEGENKAVGDALFGAFHDEIEDLTPEERDQLIQRAFLHKALQARRPVIWIPRDDIGVSDDEIRRTQKFSDKIWISNEYTGLDRKGRVVFRRAPPDFSELDLIDL